MSIQEQVRVLKFRFEAHKYETNGFKWDFEAAEPDDVFKTSPVSQDTINGLSSLIMKIIAPKGRPTLRREIAYLSGLRHRQSEVWAEKIKDFEQRTKNTNQWVQSNQR